MIRLALLETLKVLLKTRIAVLEQRLEMLNDWTSNILSRLAIYKGLDAINDLKKFIDEEMYDVKVAKHVYSKRLAECKYTIGCYMRTLSARNQ